MEKHWFRELEKESRTGHPGEAAVYEKQLASYNVCKTSERNRSHMEYRTMQTCHNTDLITLCKNQREIKTVGWLEQVRIPMEKDRDGKNITPTYEDFLSRTKDLSQLKRSRISRDGW